MRTGRTTHTAQASASSESKASLIDYLPVVRFQANSIHRRLPRGVDIDDLYSAGLVGLWEAHSKFDPNKNVRFATFAQFRIRGAILDSLRSVDWAPRSLRSKGRAVHQAINKLTSCLRRTPLEEEVAAELNLSLEAYQRLLGDLHGLEIGSIYRAPQDESGEDVPISIPGNPNDDPLLRCLQGEVTERLAKAIEGLPEQERLVLTLFYYEELTRREVSLTMGITEARVQYIRNSAVLHMRSALSGHSSNGRRRPKLVRYKIPGKSVLLRQLDPAA